MSGDDSPSLEQAREQPGESRWRPLLAPDEAEQAWEAVAAIAMALHDPSLLVSGYPEPARTAAAAGLPGGAAGLALLYAYLSRVRPDGEDAATAERFLRQAAVAIGSTPMHPGLHGGFTGIAWMIAHLSGWFLEDSASSTGAIDTALCRRVARIPWKDDYDLIRGLVGIGVYALEGLPHPTAVDCLTHVIHRLSETAERTSEGRITWRTDPRWLPSSDQEAFPEGCYHLGMAHGVPGVIALLAQARAAGVAVTTTDFLLEGSVPWLLEQQGPDHSFPFGYATGVGSHPVTARLAWCYGDLGVAAGLLSAARATGRRDWEAAATAIARRAAAVTEENSGVVDAGFCHGAAGAVHLFNRMYQATGDPVLGKAARSWFRRLLAMRSEKQPGIAGFSTWALGESGEMEWQTAPGLLMGAAGIALVLLAAVSNVEPEWDRVFLVAVPPAASLTGL